MALKKSSPIKPTARHNAASTARYARPAPAQQALVDQSRSYFAARNAASAPSDDGGSYGGGSYGGGGGGYSVAAAVAPPRLSDDDWLAQDSQYKSAVSALEQKLRDFEVENTSTREKGT